jgi:hypothetical protein
VLRATISRRVLPALVVLTASAAPLVAQTKQAGMPGMDHGQSTAAMSPSDVAAFAKVEVQIGAVRDTIQAKLAMTRNKKDEIQAALRDTLVNQVAGILKAANLTQADYEKKLFYVSTNGDARHIYDSTYAKLTGQPLPGQLAPAAATLKVPAGEVGVHIGHVVNSFADVPDKKSLLFIAQAEAAVAAQHAALGARASTDLAQMKTHAGHVLNALDPSLQATGPGKGYGLKKAAAGIAMHIDLAAKATGASQNVIVHANHISTSAKNTSVRVDQAIALCQKIQAATSAADAAALMTQLVSVTSELQPGKDANADGRVGWQEGEGGLQQIDEHVKLMLAGEGLGEF